jgi:hypothetical protein
VMLLTLKQTLVKTIEMLIMGRVLGSIGIGGESFGLLTCIGVLGQAYEIGLG